MKLNLIQKNYQNYLDKELTVKGWIVTIRCQKELCFIKLNDGSIPQGIQLIYNIEDDNKDYIKSLHTGCSISAKGVLVKSPSIQQPYELKVCELYLIGNIKSEEYPLAKTKLSLEYLRKHVHLRSRTTSFGSIFRIKSAISHATHEFFRERGFLHINPNIITVNECEGGAGVFQVTEHSLSNHHSLPEKKEEKGSHDWDRDHFGKPVFLTVSSQLQLEALACSLGSVYTTNKSFRSEHSNTHKHLSEFEHLEVEDIFINLDDLMLIAEDYIKYVGNYLLNHQIDDILNLSKFVSKGLTERIKEITQTIFYKVSYDESIKILNNAFSNKEISKNAVYGEDLCSEFENYIVSYFKGPVFVYNWPSSVKSFYMKQMKEERENKEDKEDKENKEDKEDKDNDRKERLCSNFDLLMPYHIGELIGGSMREDCLDTLLEMMKNKNISPESLSFYTDLRKYGTVPHGGFGLGLDRLCMLFTGMENIKDVVAFPVYYKNCEL